MGSACRGLAQVEAEGTERPPPFVLGRGNRLHALASMPPSLPFSLASPPERPTFSRIYEQEFEYVWSSLRRLGVASKDLEDVVHDVFVTVHRSLDSYDPARPLRPWLFGVAFRISSDFRRKAHHHREVADEGHDVEDGKPSALEQVSAREDRTLVLSALAQLGPDRRAVFILHEVNEETVPAIAEALEIPLNTAYSRLRLARQDFATAVRRLKAQGHHD